MLEVHQGDSCIRERLKALEFCLLLFTQLALHILADQMAATAVGLRPVSSDSEHVAESIQMGEALRKVFRLGEGNASPLHACEQIQNAPLHCSRQIVEPQHLGVDAVEAVGGDAPLDVAHGVGHQHGDLEHGGRVPEVRDLGVGGATLVEPKRVSPVDPAARYTQAHGNRADFCYATNYLIDVDNPLVVPVNKKIRIVTTANDVIHAWGVPAFGVKQDAIPGFVRDTWFRAEKTGDFYGQCQELCGKEHAYMPIHVKVVTAEQYSQWAGVKLKEAVCVGVGVRVRPPDTV